MADNHQRNLRFKEQNTLYPRPPDFRGCSCFLPMFLRIKSRIYPTYKQKKILNRHFDAYNFVYNLCLEYKTLLWRNYKKHISGYDMAKEVFEIRRDTEWLSKCKAECLREAPLELDKSFKKFFKGNGYPKFKSKKEDKSFHAYQGINVKGNKIKFYKNLIRIKDSQKNIELLNTSKIKKVTFKRDTCGDYWATCLIEIPEIEKLPENNKVVGIDLGLKDLVITSAGVKYENKKYLRNTYFKLRRLQRKFSKTKKGGRNREKLRKSIARVYRKATRQREWYYHQISNDLIRDNQTIVLESLRIHNMVKNHKLARSINDASWGTLTRMLEYKAKWYGRTIIKVDTFYPSSKTCSGCGNIKKELKLSEREYICECCGLIIDRDINAAINLKNTGIKIPVEPVENADISQVYEAGSNH